ncbi:FitA-like ribbon-helix-helix domain-containing protein [Tomitella fengzijianii]|uniref:Plasmid stability protein n=2 Tax=Tomitella fengzijianii TaxID=2597660 RepID=A0A516X1B6_9ACTN|nr:plasmid stability protein [Tomitella fengzijianii]QDQ96817.1 plasmid stability protein [Tomitella fengzijianii]
MAAITIRNLSAETHRALKARAAMHNRSTETEVRAIVDAAVLPADRVRLGSLLAGIGEEIGGIDLDIERDRSPHDPMDLT